MVGKFYCNTFNGNPGFKLIAYLNFKVQQKNTEYVLCTTFRKALISNKNIVMQKITQKLPPATKQKFKLVK